MHFSNISSYAKENPTYIMAYLQYNILLFIHNIMTINPKTHTFFGSCILIKQPSFLMLAVKIP